MEFAQKLISTRRGSLYIAVVAALIAGLAILVYVNRYRQNLQSGTTPVTVLIARQTIPTGTPGTVVAAKHLFTATTIRESQLREGAFSDPASLTGRIATKEIAPGSQLTAGAFSTSSSALAATISDRQRIVSIPLDAAHGLSGDVEVGNHVDVYAGFNAIPIRPDGTPANSGQARPVTKLIVPNVPVVAIGQGGAALSSKTSNVGLRVTDTQAAQITFASDNGKVWLALRPSVGARSTKPQIVTVETLLLGVRPVTVLHGFGGRG
jgi:Flp pilus assembly protein CpaB